MCPLRARVQGGWQWLPWSPWHCSLPRGATADRAAEAAQDAVLGAATVALSEGLRTEEDGLDLDLPPTTFSMLPAMGEDRVFYRVNLGETAETGYSDPPLPAPRRRVQYPSSMPPFIWTRRCGWLR